MKNAFLMIIFVLSMLFSCIKDVYSGEEKGFTQADRERLIRLETTLQAYMHATDKRFEDMNKRFEDMNKRFEDMNKRIEELRADTNKRFEELREDMNKRFEQIDKRFEQIDKRFEQVDKRFEQMITFLWIITGIFTTLTIFVIGFAYWDRRTIIEKSKTIALNEVEKRYNILDLLKLLEAAREYAKEDKRMEGILRRLHLL